MYYQYLFLEPGSYATWGNIPLGETQGGIKITISFQEELLYNQKEGYPIDLIYKGYEARVSLKTITISKANLKDIFNLTSNGVFPISTYRNPLAYQLTCSGSILTGSLIGSYKYLDVTFYKASILTPGSLLLSRTEEAGLDIEFICLYNTSQNAIGKFEFTNT